MLKPGRHNLVISRGDDLVQTFRIRYMNEDGSPGGLVPLAGWSADATLILPDDTTLPFTVNINSGLSTVTISMSDAVTITLPKQNCAWKLRLIDTDGNKLPYLIGDTFQSEGSFISG